jgi:hypothetical protein
MAWHRQGPSPLVDMEESPTHRGGGLAHQFDGADVGRPGDVFGYNA